MFTNKQSNLAAKLVQIIYCNPFGTERQHLTKDILGERALKRKPQDATAFDHPSIIDQLLSHSQELLKLGRASIGKLRNPFSDPNSKLYEHLLYFDLYHRLAPSMDQFIANCIDQPEKNLVWNDYRILEETYDHYLYAPNPRLKPDYSKEELASFVYQIRRAFYHTQNSIIGRSDAMTQLRVRVWNSIFTHNMKRYLRSLYDRMENVVTLIEGPSGSGKELVARAIGFSRFIPFDGTTRKFSANYRQVFYPINLSALSETLIESELFGHQKGAFTGALQNRAGYFESCGRFGTVFLDEIGETDPSIQVKLLRVLQTRQFQRLGDTKSLRFEGKVMAATNRILEEEVQNGNFRSDFYYRLCADRIVTPPLASMLGNKTELELLVSFIAERVAGPHEKKELTTEVTCWITNSMPADYTWPGNFRELEQCVRNVMIHGEYQAQGPRSTQSGEINNSKTPTLNQWIQTLVNREYAKTPNLAQVADRLQIDRRTVKKYLHIETEIKSRAP